MVMLELQLECHPFDDGGMDMNASQWQPLVPAIIRCRPDAVAILHFCSVPTLENELYEKHGRGRALQLFLDESPEINVESET